MLLSMGSGAAGKQSGSSAAGIKDDDVLETLLGDMKSSTKVKPGSAATAATAGKRKATSPPEKSVSGGNTTSGAPSINPFAKPKSTGIKRPKMKTEAQSDDGPPSSALELLEHDDAASETIEDVADEDVKAEVAEVTATQNIEDFDEAELSNAMEEDFVTEDPPAAAEVKCNRGFAEKSEDAAAKVNLRDWTSSDFGDDANNTIADVQVEAGNLPLIEREVEVENEDGKRVTEMKKFLRMYWLDAYEDPFKHPGTVWLFGKVYVDSAKAHVSCCVTVKNINRQIFLVKRDERVDARSGSPTGDEVSIKDVYEEFNGRIAERYKILEHKSKMSVKNYAFEHADVPESGEFLEVQYSAAKYPALPSDLKGETFSRVFGANQSSLEQFLVSREIRGPGWIDFESPLPSAPPTSWCKLEAVCERPAHAKVVKSDPPPAPPVTVMALNMKTTINPKTLQGLVYQSGYGMYSSCNLKFVMNLWEIRF